MASGGETSTDAQRDKLTILLGRFRASHAMNLEMLDGFFSALICCPDMVFPSEYLPEIWGGDMVDEEAWDNREQLQEFMDLVMQHWNTISGTLQAGDVYLPILAEDEEGVIRGNDWATGFIRGVSLRHHDWAELVELSRYRLLVQAHQFQRIALEKLIPASETDGTTRLTSREAECLNLIGQGWSYSETARTLGLSVDTIRLHLRNACGKLGAVNRAHAVAKAITLGLVDINLRPSWARLHGQEGLRSRGQRPGRVVTSRICDVGPSASHVCA